MGGSEHHGEDITIPNGTRYGQVQPVEEVTPTKEGGLHHLGQSESQAERMAKNAKAASLAAKGEQVLMSKAAND